MACDSLPPVDSLTFLYNNAIPTRAVCLHSPPLPIAEMHSSPCHWPIGTGKRYTIPSPSPQKPGAEHGGGGSD